MSSFTCYWFILTLLWILVFQCSPHLQKTGRLDFSLREHEGEVKAWQGDFQQLHRDMFPKKCVVSSHHLTKKLHLKLMCSFANIVFISFIFNFKFMFCTCIIVFDLIFVDFRFYLFRIEIYKIYITSKCEFPPLVSIDMPPCLKLDKLIVYLLKKLQITQVMLK